VVTIIYLGIAAAVVLTGTYGSDHVDHVAIGLLFRHTFGAGAAVGGAIIATFISLGTANAFIAGVSRLAYSLARSGWLSSRSTCSRPLPASACCEERTGSAPSSRSRLPCSWPPPPHATRSSQPQAS
jgi:hypothetical protein